MTSTWKVSYFALTLCLALPTIAYKWTPCSLEAWILNLQTCQQTCYGETFYNDFYNSTVCGDYDTMINSTKKSDVDCLCENQIAGISTQTNITNCTLAACSSSYNQTLYIEAEEAYTRMCSWSFGTLSAEQRACEISH